MKRCNFLTMSDMVGTEDILIAEKVVKLLSDYAMNTFIIDTIPYGVIGYVDIGEITFSVNCMGSIFAIREAGYVNIIFPKNKVSVEQAARYVIEAIFSYCLENFSSMSKLIIPDAANALAYYCVSELIERLRK